MKQKKAREVVLTSAEMNVRPKIAGKNIIYRLKGYKPKVIMIIP